MNRKSYGTDPRIQEALARRLELIAVKGMLPPKSAGQANPIFPPTHPDNVTWAERNLRCAHDADEYAAWLAEQQASSAA